MLTPKCCPACESSRLHAEVTHTFYRPDVDPVRDRDRLVASITLERLYLLFTEILPGEDHLVVTVVRCSDCQFRFVAPRLTNEEIARKYEALDRYGFVKARYALHAVPSEQIAARAERIAALVADAVALRPDQIVADVGGAWGYNLVPFVDHGCRCLVIDPERWPADRYPSGVQYLAGSVESFPPQLRFDVILFTHTLEHVSEPYAAVRELSDRMAHGGALFVEVPLGIFRETRTMTEPITHLNFFGEESLSALLRRAGLSVAHLSTRYQWVTTSAQWCVNAVAIKGAPVDREAMPTPAWLQQRHPWYFSVAAWNRLLNRHARYR